MAQIYKLFADLTLLPNYISSDEFDQIERLTVLLYQRTSELTSVNSLRKCLYSQNRNIENILPARKALEQKWKEPYMWQDLYGDTQTLIANPTVPSPEIWGWKRDERDLALSPYWTSLPETFKACRELIRCGCKTCSQLLVCFGQCCRK